MTGIIAILVTTSVTTIAAIAATIIIATGTTVATKSVTKGAPTIIGIPIIVRVIPTARVIFSHRAMVNIIRLVTQRRSIENLIGTRFSARVVRTDLGTMAIRLA
jgi:hypothetical protein